MHSSRPNNISKLSTYLERSENPEKLHDGPTLLKPGPILLMQVTTDENVVVKSKLLSDIKSNDPTINPRYIIR